jgi:hypothetical protein
MPPLPLLGEKLGASHVGRGGKDKVLSSVRIQNKVVSLYNHWAKKKLMFSTAVAWGSEGRISFVARTGSVGNGQQYQ